MRVEPIQTLLRLVAVAVRTAGLARVVVAGASMEPTLCAGDHLLVVSWLPPRAGRLVALTDPRDGRPLVKRALRVTRDTVLVGGDNPAASTDSRTFGAVPRRLVLGRVVYRYAPADRAGRLA